MGDKEENILKKTNSVRNKVTFIIEGNWGHPRKRGLTEIKFLDVNLNEYPVTEQDIKFLVD